MEISFEQFSEIIDQLEEMPISTIKLELKKVYTKFQEVGKKTKAASKLIDFFVHDILDYSLINHNQKKFIKQNMIFDVRDSI